MRGLSETRLSADWVQLQPAMLPRPDLALLNLSYRRIPFLSVGRDIYLDTRLILSKLEQLYPSTSCAAHKIRGPLASTSATNAALEALLSRFIIDGGVFNRAAQLIPPDMPLLQDSKFTKDREEYTGRPWSVDAIKAGRPEALVYIREAFELMETTLLSDGRTWVLGGKEEDGPTLADIESVWVFHWLVGMKGALSDVASKEKFPKVYAWVDRFDKATKDAKKNGPKVGNVKGSDVEEMFGKVGWGEQEALQIDGQDPTGLKGSDEVEVWPIDSGVKHRDRGSLVALTPKETVIRKKTKNGEDIRVHAPRWGFRVQKVGGSKL